MSKFNCKEETIDIRGQEVTVRELTAKQRAKWAKDAGADKFLGPAMLVSLSCVSPKFTLEEALEEPTEVIERITEIAMRLSGMGDEKKD